MDDADDLSIESIIRASRNDVEAAASHKLSRDLTDREKRGIELLINTEHFWARAEEALMFIRFNDADKVGVMLAQLAAKYEARSMQQPGAP